MSTNCVKIFDILFSKNGEDIPYKDYFLNFVDIFSDNYIYRPFIDTFYINKQFNFDLNISYFNKNYIFLLSYRDYFHSNPFVHLANYISNSDNSVFLFNYFFNFCNDHLSDVISKENNNDKFFYDVPDATDYQIKVFYRDLKVFYYISLQFFLFFQYIFYCYILKKNNNFNNIKNILIKIYDEINLFKPNLFFSKWLKKSIKVNLKIIIDNLNNNFLLYNFYNLKFLIEFSLSFHYFYIVNISEINETNVFDMYYLSNVLYFQPVSKNIYRHYLSNFEPVLSNIDDHVAFNVAFKFFTFNMFNIRYHILYNLLYSLKIVYNKLLLHIDFSFDDIDDIDENGVHDDTFFKNFFKIHDHIYNFYINGKKRFNNCLINDNLINISDIICNNNFICVNGVYEIDCIVFNTDLFSITYDNDNFYYTNDFHSISFNKKNFYSYFWNLFYKNNFYFFISSPDKIKFDDNKKFLFNLLPYIPYHFNDSSLSNFLRNEFYIDIGNISLYNICPLNFRLSKNIFFGDLSLMLFKWVLTSPFKFHETFDNISLYYTSLQYNEKIDQFLKFLYFIYVFIYIYIFNTITSFGDNSHIDVLRTNKNLVEETFIDKCAYLFNLYFINFLFIIADFSGNHIKINNIIRDDIIESCKIKINYLSEEINKFNIDYRIGKCLRYILKNRDDYVINIANTITTIKIIKKYVIDFDYNQDLISIDEIRKENIDYNDKIGDEYKSDNDKFDFSVYNILYKF